MNHSILFIEFLDKGNSLNLIFVKDQLEESRLSYTIPKNLYKQIKSEALFNLKPEILGLQIGGEFQPDLDIKIEVTLRPDLLHYLENYSTSEEALTYNATTAITDAVEEFFDALTSEIDEPDSQNSSLLTAVISFFTDEDWSFSKIKGESELRLQYQGENAEWNCLAKVREAQNQLIFYSIYPTTCPKEKYLAVSELLTQINSQLLIGNFEMDFSIDTIRFRTSLDFANLLPDEDLIQKLVYTNVETMDKYLLKIQEIIDTGISSALL